MLEYVVIFKSCPMKGKRLEAAPVPCKLNNAKTNKNTLDNKWIV